MSENLTKLPLEGTPADDDFEREAAQYQAYKIGFAIHQYYYPVLVPIGVIGNMLSLAIMLRRRNRELSFCVYLAALAVTDTLVLCSSLYIWSGLSSQSGEVGCMMVCLTFQTSSGSSIGLIFFINFDRYLATCHPFCKLQWRQRGRAVKVTIIIAIVSIMSGIVFSFTSSQINSFTCAGFATGQSLTTIILVVSYLIMFAVLPISAVIALNLAIAKTTKQRMIELKHFTRKAVESEMKSLSRQSLRTPENPVDSEIDGSVLNVFPEEIHDVGAPLDIGSDSSNISQPEDLRSTSPTTITFTHPDNNFQGDNNDNNVKTIKLFTVSSVTGKNIKEQSEDGLCCTRLTRTFKKKKQPTVYHGNSRALLDQQVSRTLFIVTVAFFFLVLPQFVRYSVYLFINYKSSAAVYATYILVYQVSQKMCATNSAINFFIYCIKGSRFRKDFFEIMKMCVRRRNRTHTRCEYIDDTLFGGM